MFLSQIECNKADECRNNNCVIRRTHSLGLKQGDSKLEYFLDRRYGPTILPLLNIKQNGLSLELECESFL